MLVHDGLPVATQLRERPEGRSFIVADYLPSRSESPGMARSTESLTYVVDRLPVPKHARQARDQRHELLSEHHVAGSVASDAGVLTSVD